MTAEGQRFRVWAEEFAIARLAADAPWPAWAGAGPWTSVTRTRDELSVIVVAAQVPAEVKHELGWRLLEVVGPFPFSAVGVIAALTRPLAEARVSVLTIATFDTDYLLVREAQLAAALSALTAAGHMRVSD